MDYSVSARTASQFNADSCVRQHRPSSNKVFVTSQSLRHRFAVLACLCLPLTLSPFAHGQKTDLGSVNVASTSSPTAVTVTFTTPATLGGVTVLTQGASGLDYADGGAGTCTTGTAYDVGQTCTVNVTFTPRFVGVRVGAVVLADTSANVVGTTYLQGTGVGPQLSYYPGTEIAVPTTVSGPGTSAIDGNGNLYLTDGNNSRLLKETYAAGTYSESVVSTGTLNMPYAVVMDGAGNLYIADSANNRVLKETLSAGNFTESTVPSSALNYPTDIAIDASGTIYIADEGNNRILVETMTSGSTVETVLPTSALNQPGAVAVDTNGTVYIADSGNNRVLVETPASGSYTESTLPTSTLNYPTGVRIDPRGNIIIADFANNRVLNETPQGAGVYIESTVPTGTLSYPDSLGIDGSGNVYVSEAYSNRVLKEDFANAPSLSFAATTVGSTSTDSPKTVTLSNYGNAPLLFSATSFPTDFPENSPAPLDCTSITPLISSASCTLTINFSPVTSLNGNPSAQLTEAVSFTTSASTSPQAINVTGTETQP